MRTASSFSVGQLAQLRRLRTMAFFLRRRVTRLRERRGRFLRRGRRFLRRTDRRFFAGRDFRRVVRRCFDLRFLRLFRRVVRRRRFFFERRRGGRRVRFFFVR